MYFSILPAAAQLGDRTVCQLTSFFKFQNIKVLNLPAIRNLSFRPRHQLFFPAACDIGAAVPGPHLR
jgi:hypothetical protein